MYAFPCKILKPGFAKYAVDANLFRLGPTNPKKNPTTVFFGFYTGGFCPGKFCPEAFCRGAFDLDSKYFYTKNQF